MKEFYLPRNQKMTDDQLTDILQKFTGSVLPVLQKRKKYYDGDMKIRHKSFENSSREPNRIVVNFVKSIVEQYAGYGMGITPRVTATSGNDTLQDILNYNDFTEQCNRLYTDALIYGRGAWMSYIDEDHKTRFDCLSPEEVIPVYSDDIEHILLYAIRMWQANDTDFWVEVMGDKEVRRYKAAPGYTSVKLFADSYHSFNQVPMSFLQLTKDCDGLCDRIFDLNDAYNSIISDSVDGEDAFADALLVLTGSFADEDDLSKLKKDRVLCLDEGSTAEYVTKDSSKSQSGSLLDRTETKIRELCAAPNFNDESFGTSSGIAIRYKLIGMENRTSSYLAAFKMTLQKQIELISYVDSILTGEEAVWRDVSIQFTRNLPVSETENAEVVAKLQGIVSDETLMTLLPFVTDPEEELKKVKKQRDENMELYQNNINNEDGDDELLAEQV